MKFQGIIAFVLSACVVAQTCERITYRKEVSDVTPDEWKIYLDTIKEAKRRGIWIEAANLHNRLNPQIHWNCVFFFWHRAFLSDMEKKLQAINPNFFFPYWDSPTVTNQVDRSPIWSQIGTVGNPVAGNPFGNDILATDNGANQRLVRDIPSVSSLNGKLPNQQLYDQYTSDSLRNGGFAYWAERMEVTHGTLHIEVGGDRGQMSNMYSPADPMFYFHHAHLDYLWVKAQDTWNAANMGAGAQFGGLLADRRSVCTFDARIPNYPQLTLNNVLNTKNICVEYLRRGQPKPTTPVTTVRTTTTSAARTTTSNVATTTTRASTTSAVASTTVAPTTAATTTNGAVVSSTTTNAGVSTTNNVSTSSQNSSTTKGETSSGVVTSTTKGETTSGVVTSKPVSTTKDNAATTSSVSNSPSASSTSEPTAATSNTNVVIITTGLQSPTSTNVPVIPTDVPRYEYPVDFKPITYCPPRLPEYWIKMLAVNDNFDVVKARTDLIFKECDDLVIRVKEGYVVPPMVDYSFDQRPPIEFTPEECARDSGSNGVAVRPELYTDSYITNSTAKKPTDGTYEVASGVTSTTFSVIGSVLGFIALL
ncbi:hypothetical protein HDV02_000778 [Globomyces sp. JEL0801]|nr:hypothetical protein HDV02_000778 [Globomyces sp. JEL0801]